MDHTYQLLIRLRRNSHITVGALGKHLFPAGYYVYTGSAKRNLAARVARHARKDKPLRWHIDYLTSHLQADVIETKTFTNEECSRNQQTEGEMLVAGFGASDCRSGCGAHLKYIGHKQPHNANTSANA